MKIYINQEEFTLNQEENLQEVMHFIGITKINGIAVAVNNKVIPKSQWEAFAINKNDSITIIKATQGG